eukprot:1154305-Pelagomonas_calceolata.AAC.2
MPCSCMYACIGECMPCKLLLPVIAYLLAIDNQQQTIHQRLSHPHTRAGGAGPAPNCISKLPCLHLSIHAATHNIRQAGMVRSWTAKSLERTLPGPGPSKGIHERQNQNFVKIFATNLFSLHPRPPKLGSPGNKFCLASMPSFRADGRLAGPGQELSAKVFKRSAQHQPLPPTPH